jgi:hypothetical protein
MSVRLHYPTALMALVCACSAPEGEEKPPVVKTAGAVPAPAVPAAASPTPAGKTPELVQGIARPLMTNLTGFAAIDRVDVGNDQDETLHKYAVQDPTFRGAHDFLMPNENISYTEDGRATKTSESFQVKVVPHQDNVLIRAFDTLIKNQKVRVSINGKVVGDWSLPEGADRYGEATFVLPASAIGDRSNVELKLDKVSGEPDTNAFVYWVFAKPEKSLDYPVKTKLAGLTLTDHLDVGLEKDEAGHGYAIDKPSYVGVQQFAWPASGLPFLENGRATKSYESFRVKVMPSKDHLLVKAFDTYSKNQKVRVLVEGNVVGEWSLPDGTPRYGESSFRIPSKYIGARNEVNVRVEFVSATLDSNSFKYWIYADTADRAG